MITIDNITYTEDQLSDADKIQVSRVNDLRNELSIAELRCQELKVLINAYAQTLKKSLTLVAEEA